MLAWSEQDERSRAKVAQCVDHCQEFGFYSKSDEGAVNGERF